MKGKPITPGYMEGYKVDPEEPWRYSCINCDSIAISVLTGKHLIIGKKYSRTDMEERKKDRRKIYYCHGCGTRNNKVYDKKRDEKRAVHERAKQGYESVSRRGIS